MAQGLWAEIYALDRAQKRHWRRLARLEATNAYISFSKLAAHCAATRHPKTPGERDELLTMIAQDLADSLLIGDFARSRWVELDTATKRRALWMPPALQLTSAPASLRPERCWLTEADIKATFTTHCFDFTPGGVIAAQIFPYLWLRRGLAETWCELHAYPPPPANSGDASRISSARSAKQRSDEANPATGPEIEPDDHIDKIANWIFEQHPVDGEPLVKEKLWPLARKAPSLGTVTASKFNTAFAKVYTSKRHAPPKGGWPLKEPYKSRQLKNREDP